MRHPATLDSERGGPPQSPPSAGGSIVLGLLLVGTIAAVSYPFITAAAVLGALTSSLYQRIRQNRNKRQQTSSSDSGSEHRTRSEATAVRDRQTRRNGNGCCEQV